MRSADLKPRTWYAEGDGKYGGNPTPLLLLGTDRYSTLIEDGVQVLRHTPNKVLSGSGPSWSRRHTTGYLAVRVQGDGGAAIKAWALSPEPCRESAPDIMRQSATLLDKVVGGVKARGTMPVKDVEALAADVDVYVRLILVQPREIAGEYLSMTIDLEQRRREAAAARDASEKAQEKRQNFLVETLAKAKALGLNTDPYRGGAEERRTSLSRFAQVEMSAAAYRELVDEIERLRELAGVALRADEVGESGGVDART